MTRYPYPRLRSQLAGAAAVVFALALLVASPAHAETGASTAATTSAAATGTATAVPSASGPSASGAAKALITDGFRAGNIISDAVFLDSSTMSAGAIDSFFRSKVPTCRSGYVCLKDYRQDTPNRAADSYCRGYQGASNESAATIIHRVSQSCGINPQVLIVMLQKEQSLVTHTWPSSWRYTMALGQGCPDTAACDPAYAGFFHQIYGAARQMKIYLEGRHFTYYAPGKTWNILYHPNSSCGRGPVRVENAATSALYYYTPYQPNAASLRAGYGEGDGCSSYGNRNFYNYFTDWFGSTQGGNTSARGLVRTADSPEIHLISDGVKHYVTTLSDLAVLSTRLGAVRTVSSSYLASVPTGNRVIRLVRDARNGAMYLLQPDGTKHHFATAELIARFGMRVDDYLPLSPAHIDAFPTGAPIGDYFRSEDSGDYFKWENGQRRHIANQLAWQRERASAKDYVAVFPAGNAAFPPRGRALLAPGTLAKEPSRNEVYIVGNGADLVHLPSWAMGADAGITAYDSVSDGAFAGYGKRGSLAPLVTCGAQTFVVDGGKLTRVGAPARTGKGQTLPDSVCAVLPRHDRIIDGPVFVKSPTSDAIYSLENGRLRHVESVQRLLELTGGRPPYTATWSSSSVDAVVKGAPYLAEGRFVTFGSDAIYVMQGGQLRHIPSPQVLLKLAGPVWPIPILRLDPTALALYKVGAPLS